ncbi:sterol desaturase family protein [Limibacillus halophilus]
MEPWVETLLSYKGIAILVWLAVFFLAERLRPAAPQPARLGEGPVERGALLRLARNAGLWLTNVGLSVGIVIPVSLWAAESGPAWRPDWFGGWQGLIFDLLLLDFLIYWWHRLNHEWQFLWRFHEVHHLDLFLDTTSAVRFHFGEVLLSALARAGVILVFDIPFLSVVAFETLVLMAAIFHHSNLRLPGGLEQGLSRVIITPSIHWVHHHAVRADTDSNYGTFFSFWDRLFGTASPHPRVLDMKIGVEKRPEKGFLALLVSPFGL